LKNLFDAVKAYCIRILPNRIPAIIKAPLGTCSLKAQVEVVATTCVSPKRAVALEVKRLYSSGVSLRSIALQLKLARQTVCKYAKLDIEIACTYKKSRERKIELANYHDQIKELVIARMKITDILRLLNKEGIACKYSTLSYYIRRIQ
jgi:hypothetical protein